MTVDELDEILKWTIQIKDCVFIMLYNIESICGRNSEV